MLFRLLLILILITTQVHVDAQHKSKVHHRKSTKNKKRLQGTASYYSDKFIGKKTASGEVFSQDKYTAACNALPLGSIVVVTNLSNSKKVKVKINDRLARHSKRLIDLTKTAAKEILFLNKGITKVEIEILKN